MRTICLVSGVQLWPPESGGQLRTSSIAEALADAGHEVRVYSLTGRKPEYLALAPSATYERHPGVTEYVDRSLSNAALQLLTYRARLPDFWHLLSRPMPKALRKMLRESDTVIADFPFLSRYLKRSSGKFRILNSHNLEHERWGRRKFLSAAVRRAEKRAAAHADVVLVTSKEEAAFYADCGKKSAVVPNGLSLKRFRCEPETRARMRQRLSFADDETVILFSASRYEPNRKALEALTAFVRRRADLLDRLRVTFLVVGSVAAVSRREQGLVVTGPVDKTEPYFLAADWALNPVTTGSGTNLKMAEYLVARLPIVSTRFGKRGFFLDEEDYLEIAFEGDAVEEALRSALAMDREKRGRMAERALEKNRALVDMSAIVRDVMGPLLAT